jgi:hypothetical protein
VGLKFSDVPRGNPTLQKVELGLEAIRSESRWRGKKLDETGDSVPICSHGVLLFELVGFQDNVTAMYPKPRGGSESSFCPKGVSKSGEFINRRSVLLSAAFSSISCLLSPLVIFPSLHCGCRKNSQVFKVKSTIRFSIFYYTLNFRSGNKSLKS